MPVAGKRFLVLEDDPILGMLLEDMLETIGYQNAGNFQTVEMAMEAISTDPSAFDAGILDVNLNGQSSQPVASLLESHGIPYLFSTGYGDSIHTSSPKLTKPFSMEDLRVALERLDLN